MSFKWHSQDILLKGIDYSRVQAIELTQLNSLMVNPTQLAGMSLYNLTPIKDKNSVASSMSHSTISNQKERVALEELLDCYKELFKEPKGLPPIRTHDHIIPMKEGAQAINLRPYRYSGGAKRHIKKDGG